MKKLQKQEQQQHLLLTHTLRIITRKSCENEIISMSRAWDKKKNLNPQQDANLRPPKHRAGALSTLELRRGNADVALCGERNERC